MNLSVYFDRVKLRSAERMLAEIKNGLAKAMAGAVNDTLENIKTATAKGLTERLAITQRDVKQYLKIKRAQPKPGKASGVFSVERVKRPNLAKFKARQTKKGVTFRIVKSGSRKLIPGAFGRPDPKRPEWVAIRSGRARHPLVFLRGVSVYAAYLKAGIHEKMAAFAEERLAVNLWSRIHFLMLAKSGKIKMTKGRAKALE
jgi:hypothetical protein